MGTCDKFIRSVEKLNKSVGQHLEERVGCVHTTFGILVDDLHGWPREVDPLP